jgi:tetratricopeptide (TPR) repeat protein
MAVIGNPGLWQLKKGFLLYHMGKFPIAIEMIQQTSAIVASPPEGFFLHPWILQAQLLRRVRQNHEALELIRAAVAVGCQKYWTDNDKVFNLQLYFLLAELATTWGLVGQPKRALKAAEQAVVTCRKDVGEAQKCVLIHALTTLSNCLAAVWRNNEALTIAQEAVSLYAQNAPHMWGNFLFTIRKQELGGNAFLALSLRLSTSGKAEQAWSNAEEATKLYRELVALAPRHLPTLATSLRNLATLLWEAGRRDEALAACEEAVNLMRKAAGPETYFLPSLAEALSELACFLAENGHVDAAGAASAECAEAQRKFALLAPQPEFLFQEVVTEVESDVEDIEGSNEARETASEDDDEHLDASEPPEVVSEAARTLMLESPSVAGLAAADEVIPDATVTPEPEAPVIPDEGAITSAVVLEEGLTATDTAISFKTPFTDILNKPLEVKLSLRSTPMDIVWWMVLGILVAIVWSRIV